MNFTIIKYKVTNFLVASFGSMPNAYLALGFFALLILFLYIVRKAAIQKGLQLDRDMVFLLVGFVVFFVIFFNYE